MVLARELLLIISFFVVMKLNAVVHSTTDKRDYECQYIPELYNKTMENADPCLESQLTDDSRLKLLDIFNEYRRNISKGLKNGKKYSNVFEVRYHWICEYVAAVVGLNTQILWNETRLEPHTVKFIFENELKPILSQRPPAVNPSLGSLGNSPKDDWSVGFEDTFTVFPFVFNDITQKESITAFITHIRQMTDLYLTINATKVIWPETTRFGCSIHYNNTSLEKEPNRLTCVFLTMKGAADRDYEEGIMSEDTCNKAPAKGKFVSDASLCRDHLFLNDSHIYDVPCQFFYGSRIDTAACEKISGISNELPVLVDSCNEEDPTINDTFAVPPDGFTLVKIAYNGTQIEFEFDGALKLHSIPMYLIVVMAFLQKFFS